MRAGKIYSRDEDEISSSSKDCSRVDLNNLIKRVRDEEKKNKRSNTYLSVLVLTIVAIFGIILTL